jgi:tetratricopeptide (TPR) repeat protein
MGQYDAALADFDRAIDLETEADWCFYGRAMIYWACNQPDTAQMNIDAAIQYALQRYEKDPQDRSNTFNLALYYLADKAGEKAELLCREAIEKATRHELHIAIHDLNDFLKQFQGYSHALSIRELLQRALESINDEQVPVSDE